MSTPETDQGDSPREVRTRRDIHRGSAGVPSMLRESVIVVVLALLLSLIVKTWLMQAFYIPSESMENTLLKGDRVIVNKLVPSPISLKRGDVVVFQDPDHWLAEPVPVQRSPLASAINETLTFVGLLPSDSGNHLIMTRTRTLKQQINHELLTSAYGVHACGWECGQRPGDTPSEESFNITVPAGRVWVMGDHRSDSADSRPHDENSGGVKGSVPESLIVGRAITVVWPISHWAWLSNPSETFAKVPTATAK